MITKPSRLRRLTFEPLETRLTMDIGLGAGEGPPANENQAAIVITPPQQLLVELINRARRDPTTDAARWEVPLNQGIDPANPISPVAKQPLAINQALMRASQLHSEDMIARSYFAHTNPDGKTPSDRAIAAGYPVGVGENLSLNYVSQNAIDSAAIGAHRNLFRSPGHRQNMLNPSYRDIGTAVVPTVDPAFPSYNKILTTEKFGSNWMSNRRSITGIVFNDRIENDFFYSLGEGVEGIRVEALDSSGNRYATTTGPSGGYNLLVPPAAYQMTFSGGLLGSQRIVRNMTISTENSKLDLDLATVIADPSTRNMDVDKDGFITPLDVLTVINHLNQNASQYSEDLDVDLDRTNSPLDVLSIVNHLNQRTTASRSVNSNAEGEANGFEAEDDVVVEFDLSEISMEAIRNKHRMVTWPNKLRLRAHSA